MSASCHNTTAGGVDDRGRDYFQLPECCRRKLDAEGCVRGKTWRDMPGREGIRSKGSTKPMLMVLNWWLWRRGLLNLRTAQAEATAAEDAASADE